MKAQDDLTLEYIGIDDVDEATYNPRSIDPQQFAKLKDSLREFGFMDAAVANPRTRRLVGGHMRRRAWKELGHDTFPVQWKLFETDEEEMAANVALNNLELMGTWDKAKLVEVLDAVKKMPGLMEATGFEQHQVERFRRQVAKASGTDAVYKLASKFLEHYDYVVIFCDNETDFAHLRQVLGVETEMSYKKDRKGLGRVIPFREFIGRWEKRNDTRTFGSVGGEAGPESQDGGGRDPVQPGEEDGPAGP